jgi:hypothetical protein
MRRIIRLPPPPASTLCVPARMLPSEGGISADRDLPWGLLALAWHASERLAVYTMLGTTTWLMARNPIGWRPALVHRVSSPSGPTSLLIVTVQARQGTCVSTALLRLCVGCTKANSPYWSQLGRCAHKPHSNLS